MTNKILAEHYIKMMVGLNKYYPCRNFFKELQGLEDNINSVWEECLAKRTTLMKFLGTLKAYQKGMGDLFKGA